MGSATHCDGNDNKKMDIMATSEGVHIAATTALKNICKKRRCNHSVNDPLDHNDAKQCKMT